MSYMRWVSLWYTSLQCTWQQQIVATYKSLTNQWAITLMHGWQSVFQQTAWQVDNLFPLLSVYSIQHAPLSQEGSGCLHLPHLSGTTPPPPPIFTHFNHKKKVCVTLWALASASLIQTIREGRGESMRAWGYRGAFSLTLFPAFLVWLWYGVDRGYKARYPN